jgi:hypothetical protein
VVSNIYVEKNDMGASVGIGGLIVGISMLVVFSMAYQSINAQIESGIERIEGAEQPVPTFTIDNADVWEGAIVNESVTSVGSSYTGGGTVVVTGTGSGFSATYATNSGAVESITILTPGNYSAGATISISGDGDGNAAFSVTQGQYIFANITNTGSNHISFDDMLTQMSAIHSAMLSDTLVSYDRSTIPSTNWYSGETLYLQWNDVGATTDPTRMALTVDSTTSGVNLA